MEVFDLLTVFFIIAILVIYKTFIIVPEEFNYIKEKWGKYVEPPLSPGFHFLIPFVEKVHYQHTLKEVAYDVPPQECITKDNVSVEVDGILYLKIFDAARASYGIDNYLLATTQLAKTTLRAEIGKLNLDDTFADRDQINQAVVKQVDHATEPWGLKVTRYEIKNITPPKQVLHSMEQQMRAEREKRAEVTISEGERASRINRSMGERQEAINMSEGEKQKRINEAEGKAKEIEAIANATATGIKLVADAISKPGGEDAVNLQVTLGYLDSFGKILANSKTTILPTEVANIVGMFQGLSKVTTSLPNIGDKK